MNIMEVEKKYSESVEAGQGRRRRYSWTFSRESLWKMFTAVRGSSLQDRQIGCT